MFVRLTVRAIAIAAMIVSLGLLNVTKAQGLTVKTDNVSINGGFADFGGSHHRK